jgi:hypothetical protein
MIWLFIFDDPYTGEYKNVKRIGVVDAQYFVGPDSQRK